MNSTISVLSDYISSMQDGFAILNPDGEIQYFNKAFAAISSDDEQVYFGAPITEALSELQLAMFEEKRSQALVSGEETFVLKGGNANAPNYYQFRLTKQEDSGGKLQGWICSIHEDHVEKLVNSELSLTIKVLQRIGNLVILLDAEAKLIYCAPSARTVLGYHSDHLIGEGWLNKTFEHKEEALQFQNLVKEWASGTAPIPDVGLERRVKTQDGRCIWMSWQFTAGPQGVMIGVAHDISELKETELALRNSEQKLRAKNRELDTFVYKASHDLKGPLASIMGLINVAEMENPTGNYRKYLDLISKSAFRLDKILSDLLRISRTTHGTFEVKPLDLEKCLQDIIESIRHAQGAETVEISLNNGVEHVIYSNIEMLTSIFQNLFDNALKYRNHKVPVSRLSIETCETPDGICVKVSDNGLGIAKDIQHKIFDMFFRGNLASDGTGLGLYIVQKTVEKLEGRIEMNSAINEGSEFTIYLPCKKGDKSKTQ